MKKAMALAVALSVSASLSASPVLAEELAPADRADIQCFALTAAAANAAQADPQQMAGLVGGMMYYYGRLRGRTPDADWLAKIRTYLLSPGVEADLATQQARCGADMVETGTELAAWGEALQAEGH